MMSIGVISVDAKVRCIEMSLINVLWEGCISLMKFFESETQFPVLPRERGQCSDEEARVLRIKAAPKDPLSFVVAVAVLLGSSQAIYYNSHMLMCASFRTVSARSSATNSGSYLLKWSVYSSESLPSFSFLDVKMLVVLSFSQFPSLPSWNRYTAELDLVSTIIHWILTD